MFFPFFLNIVNPNSTVGRSTGAPLSFCPVRFWSGCTFKSQVWCDCALTGEKEEEEEDGGGIWSAENGRMKRLDSGGGGGDGNRSGAPLKLFVRSRRRHHVQQPLHRRGETRQRFLKERGRSSRLRSRFTSFRTGAGGLGLQATTFEPIKRADITLRDLQLQH